MKTYNLYQLVISTALFFLITNSNAQVNYSDNLYKTCKVWGFMKYYHSEVSTCKVNWDSVLVATLPNVKNAQTTTEFNSILYNMLLLAGPMAEPISVKPTINPALNVNYDTVWIHNLNFSDDVIAILDSVTSKFRPHTSCYVSLAYNNHGAYEYDDSITVPNPIYPDEYHRLLLAFRYWNIIRYFSPNTNLMDTPWDSTLSHFVLRFANATSDIDYNLTFVEFVARTNDAIAQGGSNITSSYFGTYYPNFLVETIENKTVVTYIFSSSSLHVGDIITAIDGVPIDSIKAQQMKYITYSNNASLNYNLNRFILRGTQNSTLDLSVTRAGINQNFTAQRTLSGSSYYYNVLIGPNDKRPVAKAYQINDAGYINLGNISSESDLQPIFDSLSGYNNLILDLRNNPRYSIAYSSFFKNIADNVRPFCLMSIPDITFPGMLSRYDAVYFGSPSPTSTYFGNIYVLVNGNTGESTEFSVMALQSLPNVKVVGSQTFGNDGDQSYLQLSGSFYTIFSNLQPRYPDSTIAQRNGIKIDIPVTPTINGIIQGTDEILEKALSLSTSINDVSTSEQNISMYPNPSKGIVNIISSINTISSMTVSLYNSIGVKVLEKNILREDSINISSLTKGLYYIQIQQGSIVISKSLVIE